MMRIELRTLKTENQIFQENQCSVISPGGEKLKAIEQQKINFPYILYVGYLIYQKEPIIIETKIA